MLLSLRDRCSYSPLQIIHYTEPGDDRGLTEQAQKMAERVLQHINETIREQEGKERLKEISQDLWVGQGYVSLSPLPLIVRAPLITGWI